MRPSATHNLKTWPTYYERILTGQKTFEVRRNDRDFQVDDFLILSEWDPAKKVYTGRGLGVKVTYLYDLGLFGVAPGFVVMSFRIAPGFVRRSWAG